MKKRERERERAGGTEGYGKCEKQGEEEGGFVAGSVIDCIGSINKTNICQTNAGFQINQEMKPLCAMSISLAKFSNCAEPFQELYQKLPTANAFLEEARNPAVSLRFFSSLMQGEGFVVSRYNNCHMRRPIDDYS